MKKLIYLVLIFLCFSKLLSAQYVMSNLTVYDCQGSLTDSEANALNSGWYDNNENFSFVICPNGAYSIAINFTFFLTEPINDYIMIYDGPDNTYPVLGGPYSGTNLPPQIVSNGCVTITFISDVNVTSEGFELNWEAQLIPPQPPVLSFPITPNCSTNVLTLMLDQNMHCDSVSTSQISLGGQLNQNIVAIPLNCLNDSTNMIQLSLSPGLNESGNYNIYFQSYFTDECNTLWDLSAGLQFIINDCPLQVDLTANNTEICLGECVDLYTNVSGGDVATYNYSWNPTWQNSPGIQTVCPSFTTQYIVIVDDNSPAVSASDTIIINVDNPPVLQLPFAICETDVPVDLTAVPSGGSWSGTGIVNTTNGTFDPDGLPAGIYTVNYDLGACDEQLDITVLDIYAGSDMSACINTAVFNLNTALTTPGGSWSGCTCIQPNGDIIVGSIPTVITAIYTLPNGCSDTLIVSVVNEITMPVDTTLCQQSGNVSLISEPINGIWSVLPSNNISPSICTNPIITFPHQEGWESGLNGWTHDPNNDFDWITNTGPTPSGNTGPSSSYEESYYIYTEASGSNHPAQSAGLISPCINVSAYNNPVLHFWYHMYGTGQGSLAIDISVDNGVSWTWNYWSMYGNQGNQWFEAAVDLSVFNSSELKIRIRVVTGDTHRSDVAIDKLSILGGPVTPDGDFLTDVATSGTHNLMYSIQGCDDFVNITINEINAGPDQIACPLQSPFNLIGSPAAGVWSGNNVTNTSLGIYDPSLFSGLDIITYSFNGCVDTAEILVVDTDVQIDSLFFCLNSGIQILDMSIAPRTPWNGVWSGLGIVSGNFPGEFDPNIAGVGMHTIIYEANTCVDSFIISVLPRSVLSDTLICSASNDIILNVNPSGGYWSGNGIINNTTGLFSPSQLSVGIHYLEYTALNNCVDTFIIEIYNSPVLSLSGLNDNYCFIDSNILISTSPASGGLLSGNGVSGNLFNPAIAGAGYHTITFTYGTGNCLQSIDTVVFIEAELLSAAYISDDSLCLGDVVTIGANASGGIGSYVFSWDNGLSNSFEHLISPSFSTDYIVIISDGCSDDVSDTIKTFVYPTFDMSFNTSEKVCYGDSGFAKVSVIPAGNYDYLWNNIPPSTQDSIYALANRNYQLIVTDNNTNCYIEDTISIPGYGNIFAYFFPNQTECISLLDGNVQFINNSIINTNEISSNSYWDFGDETTSSYVNYESPMHTYTDTGLFNVILYLENIGGCKDSINHIVCIMPDMEIYVPNSFTPNGDDCNDEFYIKGAGGFHSFNIKIHKRWGAEIIFESNEILVTNHLDDGNICNTIINNDDYYKMGSWNGVMINGLEAPQGVYPYVINYMHTKESNVETLVGLIILIR
ncbi:MAG: gliding motility-associated C-terminal domain-containing protein [Bacteroidota bacterium]|nr:gliding motility-associated C-terminal domain-containing protein [Bacteroidota bacterium]